MFSDTDFPPLSSSVTSKDMSQIKSTSHQFKYSPAPELFTPLPILSKEHEVQKQRKKKDFDRKRKEYEQRPIVQCRGCQNKFLVLPGTTLAEQAVNKMIKQQIWYINPYECTRCRLRILTIASDAYTFSDSILAERVPLQGVEINPNNDSFTDTLNACSQVTETLYRQDMNQLKKGSKTANQISHQMH